MLLGLYFGKGGGIMRRRYIIICFALVFFFFAFENAGFAWQGRMGGMGDPYGLIPDESDFFIHPSKMKKGEHAKFYANFRYTHPEATDWNYGLNRFLPTGAFNSSQHFYTSGSENTFNGNIGSTFPAGPGAMGIFFSYEGEKGKYDGSEYSTTATPENFLYDLSNKNHHFQLTSIYSFPLGDIKMGTELGIAKKSDDQESFIYDTKSIRGTQNYPWSWAFPYLSTFPFMIPYDSDYTEIQGKIGIQRQWDASDIVATVRGAHIISGNNDYIYSYQSPLGTTTNYVDMYGNVKGYSVGTDVWFRHSLHDNLVLPFLLEVNYANRERDGLGTDLFTGDFYDYTHEERAFDLTVGGGVEKSSPNGGIFGIGLYYRYVETKDAPGFYRITPAGSVRMEDNLEFPLYKEHMVLLRIAHEKEMSSSITVRGGIDTFYGWVDEGYQRFGSVTSVLDDVSLDGNHWGIQGSVGATVHWGTYAFEPFVNGGYQSLDLDGTGVSTQPAGTIAILGMDTIRKGWFIGAGISILFGK